jgi:predicted nucleic acid-binding protein
LIVVDASMALSWQFEDEATPAGDAALQRAVNDGAVVPAIWRLEVANALRMAVRRKRCSEAFVNEAISRLEELAVEDDNETSLHAWGATFQLARDEVLTLYDAAYLELALRRNLPLATGDNALIAAGKRRGLELLTR